MATQAGRSRWSIAIVIIAVGFGLLTIKSGGTVLFGDDAVRITAGDYVPFVLWFNFLAGFAYVIAGAGLWLNTRWSLWLCIAIAATTLLVFLAFGLHILSGGDFEIRTVMAMSIRSVIWVSFAGFAWFRNQRNT